jgi:hypothetical protein
MLPVTKKIAITLLKVEINMLADNKLSPDSVKLSFSLKLTDNMLSVLLAHVIWYHVVG